MTAPKKDTTASRSRSLAEQADRHDLYQRAVQNPEADADMLVAFYRKYGAGHEPKVLCEDFCGTGYLAAHWVKGDPQRRAIGIDLDESTLQWGRARHIEPLGPEVAERIRLLPANVLDALDVKSDIACALNFSYCVLKTRKLMLAYLQAVHQRLAPGGIFVLDVFGGTDSMGPDETQSGRGDFVYRWEQSSFDPLSHEILCFIHFDFPDGSSLERAFTYDWRLWTVPELRDLLEESGFSKVHPLWERVDYDGEWSGNFYEPEHVVNQASWWTYIVAER